MPVPRPQVVQRILQADERGFGGLGASGFLAGAAGLALGGQFGPGDAIRHLLQHMLERGGPGGGVGVTTRLKTREQGPPGVGIPGPAGGSAVQRLAGETLSALVAVYELAGVVFRLDQADGEHIALLLGITLTAADAGAKLNIQRTGVIDDAAWAWNIGRVWLGTDGALTQVPPTQGFNLLIGAAVSPTRLILNLQDPIDLE